MASAAAGATFPVRVEVGARLATARVCAVIVTWNRKGYVTTVLEALSRQTYPLALLDVVVVDNAGTDGTLEHLREKFKPERVIENDTERAHEPKFVGLQRASVPVDRKADQPAAQRTGARNSLGLASLTVVRNRANMGGCGGFNTGFAFVEQFFGIHGAGGPPFVWLVDDDVDLPPEALANLVAAMESDAKIGLVGSRTCDIANRSRTIETTIYYNRDTGVMQDDAPPGHSRHEAHRQWIARVGGPRGQGGAEGYRGLMDVDVVSACSMLARWKAVAGDANIEGAGGAGRAVGFWDHRYFIYCDDADWCLRMAKAGWRVVLNLDAVVFHTPWNLKLTPARIYYACRNRLWMAQKVLPVESLRKVTRAAMKTLLYDSLHAAMHRRQFHARIILQTGLDTANVVVGKTGSDGPPAMATIEALRQAGCLHPEARVAVLCGQAESLSWLADLQERVAKEIGPGEASPQWVPIVRNDVPDGERIGDALRYGRHLGSRLKKQLWVLKRRPRAVVVFNQVNDFPVLLCASWTVHIDTKKMESAQIERDGWGERIGFVFKWLGARIRLMHFARTVRPFVSETRYG